MKKSEWIYFSIAGIIIILGVVFAVKFGMRARPIPKISWSQFKSPEDYGKNIYKRLRNEVNQQQILFLGVTSNNQDHIKIWKSFLEEVDGDHKFEKTIIDSSLLYKSEISFHEEINIEQNSMTVISVIKELISKSRDRLAKSTSDRQGPRIAILAPTVFISQLVDSNFIHSLRQVVYPEKKQKYFPVDWMAFSLSSFPLSRQYENKLEIPCNTEPKDVDGSGELGCLILMKARANYRKAKIPKHYSGMLDQVGQNEYLALFSENE